MSLGRFASPTSFYSPPVLSLKRRDVLFPFSVISFARLSLQIDVYAPFFCSIYRPIHTLPRDSFETSAGLISAAHRCVCVWRSITTALLCSKAELWLIKEKQSRTGLMRRGGTSRCMRARLQFRSQHLRYCNNNSFLSPTSIFRRKPSLA
jgi:hypothetical protein